MKGKILVFLEDVWFDCPACGKHRSLECVEGLYASGRTTARGNCESCGAKVKFTVRIGRARRTGGGGGK